MSKLDENRKLPHVLRRYERKGGLFRAEYVDLEFSNGERRTYTRLLRQGPGGVIIVAMPDDEHALLIREYAGGQHRYELGLPKGRLEPGEHSTEGANRELQEECGYAARSLQDRKSTRLNSSHVAISYAVFCLKKKKTIKKTQQ